MKRTSIIALVVGVLVAAIVIALHMTRVLLPLEEGLMNLITNGRAPSTPVSVKVQYAMVIALSLGVAWLVMATPRRSRLLWLIAALAVEVIALTWVCLLFHVFFQPLPSIFAVALGLAAANGCAKFSWRSRSGVVNDLFRGRLSDEKLNHLAAGDLPFASEAKSYEVTAVVCDIANKHDLADELSPAQLAAVMGKFIQHATQSFLQAGAYIETVTGEGIVAIFGFPAADSEQAEKATRHALSLQESFDKMRDGWDGASGRFGVHLGISSGTMIMSPVEKDDRSALLSTGEPVELARRFCIANRFYGSRILIGPRTFELASKMIVARPIDFLSGVDVRERHEIYEPLGLTTEATADEVARRDYFWNGVVLYREKRWAEAYSQFQKARGPNDQDDAPLQLYVRRLEPLALQLTDSPLE